jgi:hypothetical protein
MEFHDSVRHEIKYSDLYFHISTSFLKLAQKTINGKCMTCGLSKGIGSGLQAFAQA